MQKIKIFVLLVTLLASLINAGVGGKLAGSIHSLDGDAMTGVNVLIEGTPLGTASDLEGEYFIINVPPGTYTVKFQMIGYKIAVHQQVRVVSDFTTRLYSVLEPVALDAQEEVIVTATRPLIQRDATATIRVISADDLIAMPINNFKDVLVTQAGFTADASGGIHVRGGRTKEILYMIDGVIVQDPLEGDFSGTVNQNAIQEMTVISGTFNAEYGQAMSSVVNIVTKEGGKDFHGRFEYTSDQLNPSPYHSPGAFEYLDPDYIDEDTAFVYVDLKESLFDYISTAPDDFYPQALIPLINLPLSGQTSISLGGPFLGKTNYFVSAFYGSEESPLAHGVEVNQDVQLKLSNRLTSKLKLSGLLHSSNRLYQRYSHSWKYLPQNHTYTLKTNDRLALTLTHSLSEAWFYNIHLSTQTVATKTGVQNLTPAQYERPVTDATVYFYSSGTQGTYRDNRSFTNSVNLNTTYNANKYHLIKSGITFARHNLDINTEEEPWLGGTNFQDDTTFTPTELACYVQDKIEFDYLIINLGLRYDRVDPRIGMWEDITRFAIWDSATQNWTAAPVVDAPQQAKWSPRIGLAYPVTEHPVFHFSSG
ncbi:MAG: TonB-dependent receptor, partial [Candidatus Marinimicrobia bacterium]|nr:TonB-dependent receptor [Candidatus Neomarinimicrobiota bacterium]